jgi:hypothetical protein
MISITIATTEVMINLFIYTVNYEVNDAMLLYVSHLTYHDLNEDDCQALLIQSKYIIHDINFCFDVGRCKYLNHHASETNTSSRIVEQLRIPNGLLVIWIKYREEIDEQLKVPNGLLG